MNLTKVLILALCAARLSPASSIFNVVAPNGVTVGSTIGVDVTLTLGAGDVVQGYQLDIGFPSFLSAQSITGKGYFAANSFTGIGFDTIDPAATSVTTIYDLLGPADQLPGDTALFSIGFLVTGTGTGTISVNPSTALLFGPLDPGSGLPTPVVFTTSDATLTASPTPEPAAWLLTAGGLILLAALRHRRLEPGISYPLRSKR